MPKGLLNPDDDAAPADLAGDVKKLQQKILAIEEQVQKLGDRKHADPDLVTSLKEELAALRGELATLKEKPADPAPPRPRRSAEPENFFNW